MARPIPLSGDVLIRTVTLNRSELIDLATHKFIDGPFDGYPAAFVARLRNARGIWQQNLDDRGRPLGEPFKLPLR